MAPSTGHESIKAWIPHRLSFETASKVCNSPLFGGLADFKSWEDLELMAILSPNRVENSSQVTVWLPYRQNGSGLFYNIYSKELFNETLWSSGQPGLYKQCLICEMTGCQSEDCQIKQSFFCSYDQWPVVAKIRGLCMNTALSFAYYPYSKIGFFSWVSIDGTYIIYNSTAQMWQIAVADNNVQ